MTAQEAMAKEMRVLRHPNLRASSRGKPIGLWRWGNRGTASTAAVIVGVPTVLSPFHIHGGVRTPVGMLVLFPLFLQFCGLARCHDDPSYLPEPGRAL
jgi:hypothetical protein